MSNSLTTNQGGQAMTARRDPRIDTVRGLLETAAPKMAAVLPEFLTPERLVQVAVACISRTPKLLECTPSSLLHAIMQCAELGLTPSSALGEAYLVPFKDKVTMIPGYRGLVALARRSGQIKDIESVVVREGDRFRYKRGIRLVLEHTPKLGNRQKDKLIAVYMVAWLKGSARPHVEVMDRTEVDAIRARSRSANDGPWVTDYDEMARKTVVRRGVKMLPMSVALARAVAIDDEEYGGDADAAFDLVEQPRDEQTIATAVTTATGSSLKDKARRKAASLPAPVNGAIEDSFLADEPEAAPVAAPAAAVEPPAPPAPRALTPEEREADQAEAHFAAEDAKRREAERAAKAAADRAAMMRVPAPKKPAPAGPDEVKLSDFKLQSPSSGAAPVEREPGEDG